MREYLNSRTGTILAAILCFVLSLAIASPAAAAPTILESEAIELFFVPEPTLQVLHPELGQLLCYTLPPFKELLLLDVDHQYAISDIQDLKLQLTLVENNLKDADTINKASVRQYEIMREDRDRISKKWTAENKKRHVAETRSVWDDWTTYALIVAGTVAIAEGAVLYFTIKGD